MISKDSDLATELLPGVGYIQAEALYAASHEGARSLVDILARRLRFAMESSDHGISIARDVAVLVAPTLGWDESEIDRQVALYEKYVSHEMAAI